ncbi:MAG: GNAT family N-acetyltransferase [Pseudomonadota bacterium]|nr:GNAT family N-acetyltransferase [Pseudomonadota bacterium]
MTSRASSIASQLAPIAEPPRLVPVTTPGQVAAVAALAQQIWYEFYVPLIGRAQVDYMVGKFQNAPAVQTQIEQGYEYFLVRQEHASAGSLDIGYCAVQQQPGRVMFVSKFYLHHAARGSGTGRRCMEFIEGLARGRDLRALWLTVNKGNPSVRAYQRLGFRITEELVMDIGGGFVMDDYRMEKALLP